MRIGGGHRARLRDSVQGPPSARTVLIAAARSLLQATSVRIRDETVALGMEFERERLLLQQQLDHLEAPLQLLQRLLPAVPVLDGEVLVLTQAELLEALEQFDLATRTMAALLPRFREATTLRLESNLGESLTGIGAKLFCARRRRLAGNPSSGSGSSFLQSFEKRRREAALQMLRLEKQHEKCVLDILLSFHFFVGGELLPPPDAPSRCAECCRHLLSGQSKLHQAHALLCQLLVDSDDMLLPLLEWQIEAANADFRVAKAVLECLPRDRNRLRGKAAEEGATQAVKMRCEERARIPEAAITNGPPLPASRSDPSSSVACRGTPDSRLSFTMPSRTECDCNFTSVSEKPPCSCAAPATQFQCCLREEGTETTSDGFLLSPQNAPSSVPNLNALGPNAGLAQRKLVCSCDRAKTTTKASASSANIRLSQIPPLSPSALRETTQRGPLSPRHPDAATREGETGLSVFCTTVPGTSGCSLGVDCLK